MIKVGVTLNPFTGDGFLPRYATSGSAGADLCAAEDEVIPSGEARLIRTGVYIELPEGYAGFIQPRSGLALKHKVTVLNTPGLIDSDYRGELQVLLINHNREDFVVSSGDRIAQLVIQKVERCEFILTELSETDRGSGGFGSTGHR